MEDLCQRIPFVAVMIFRELNNPSLIISKEASRELSQFMRNERFYWLRIIKIYNKNFLEYKVLWKKVLEKTPVNIIRQLAYAIRKFFMQKAHRCCSHRINARPPRFEEFTASLQWTPLHIIAYCGLFELYKYAHGKTGEVNPQNMAVARSEIPGGLVVLGGDNVSPLVKIALQNINGETPLHFACQGGHMNICEFVLGKINDKNPGRNDGGTPLHSAAQNGRLEICKLMMKGLENSNPGNNNGWTPMHSAALNGHLKVCELIIKSTQDKNPSAKYGNTPLHVAAIHGHLKIVELIMDSIGGKNPGDVHGLTPLHKAAENGHLKVCELIMEDLEDINPGDEHGATPLHFAARKGHLKVCELIMKRLLDKNPPTSYGFTPLHLAAMGGHFNLCKLICKNVSKIDILAYRQNVGWTPIKFAVDNKKWSVVWLLARFQSAL